MESSTALVLAADAILLLHVLFVAFVVLGLVSIFIGNALKWSWIRNPWFRLVHLVAIGVVVVQAWLGLVCPLTAIEMALRARAGMVTYSGTLVSYWLERILYFQAPPWVFIVCYTLFAAAVLASWFWIRPRNFIQQQK